MTAPKKENGRGFFLCYGRTTFGVRPLEQPIRSVRYITATHVISSKQARHDSVAQSVSLEFTHGTYGLGVWYKLFSQALSVTTRSRIARHCYAALCGEYPVCVAVRKQLERLRSRNGRTLCAPTEDEQYARSLASLSSANFAVPS